MNDTPNPTANSTAAAPEETVSDHLREAFDGAKEAVYGALSETAQDAEDEAGLAEQAIKSFLENLVGKTETEVGKAAALLQAEFQKIL